MKSRLDLRRLDRDEMAAYLREAEIVASEATAEASVYRCRPADGGSAGTKEAIAIAIAGDGGFVVELAPGRVAERRSRKAAKG